MARKPQRRKKNFKDEVDDKELEFKGKKISTKDARTTYSNPNDWRWYAQNEQLLRDSASFSYNNPLGNQLDWGPLAGGNANGTSVPGVMAIYTAPAFGYAQHENSPINVAARNVYSGIRHANSGAANYEATDIMLYLIAMDSCYSYLSFLKRAYGVAMTQSFTNRYYPRAVVEAMGIDYLNVQSNLANFRYFINSFANKLGNLCIPASMSYMARHMWMYDGYYLDSPLNDKAQTYMYVPELFYRYTLDNDKAGCLVPVYLNNFPAHSLAIDSGVLLTVQQLINYGNSLIDPILASQDCGIMSGDILKAYGPTGIILVDEIPESYTVLPIYSEEVLSQISNATFMGRTLANAKSVSDTSSYDPDTFPVFNVLHQDTSKTVLQYQPLTSIVSYDANISFGTSFAPSNPYNQIYRSGKMINFKSGEVDPARTMVASRLTNIANANLDVKGTSLSDQPATASVMSAVQGYNSAYTASITFDMTFQTVGSDYASFAKIFYYSYENRGLGNTWSLYCTEDIYTVLNTVVDWDMSAKDMAQKNADDFRRTALISNFDWHPQIALIQFYKTSENSEVYVATPFTNYLYDINYYTILSEYNLQNMAQTALLSQFNAMQFGKVSSSAFAR